MPLDRTWRRLMRARRVLWNWTISNLHNFYVSGHVIRFSFVQKMPAGLLPASHPWVTGHSPHTGRPIWPDNLVYATPRRAAYGTPPEEDDALVARVGRFMAAMVERSTHSDPEIEQGPRRRMPHAVNYLHGPVHFNGGYVLFNDFAEAIEHITDPAFVRELRRFAREERRELTLVFRERAYDPEALAWCVACVRAHLPWYANGNGPNKPRVLYGTPAPYANINPISGVWIEDVERLRRGQREGLVRPPIPRARYFQGRYHGSRRASSGEERFHAWVMYLMVKARGFQGGMVFTRRRRIEPTQYARYRKKGRRHEQIVYPLSNPLRQIGRAHV